MPTISESVPEEKRDRLQAALESPQEEANKIILDKAKSRGWLTDDVPESSATPEKSFTKAQAVIRKFGEGLTGGLSTPIAGAITGAFDPNISVSEGIRRARAESKDISTQYPLLAPASEIAGIVTPQGLFGKVAGGTTKALSKIKGGGRLLAPLSRIAGQTLGAGVTTATGGLAQGQEVKDVANDIINNMALGAGLGVAGEGAAVIGKGIRTAGKKILSSLRGIGPESVSLYAQNPKAVNEAIKQQMEGNFLPQFVDDVQGKIKDFVGKRTQELDDILASVTEPVSIEPLVNAGKQELSKLTQTIATPLRQKQINTLKDQLGLLENLSKEKISASQVQEIKRQLQEQLASFFEASPKKIKANTLDRAIENIEKAAVKTVEGLNPRIDQINKELKRGIELQNELKLGNVFREGFDLEKSRRLLSTLSNEAKSVLRKSAQELDELMGTNFISSSRLFRAAKDLATADVLSALSTGRSILPIALGAATGGLLGQDTKSRGALGLAGALLASPAATRPIITGGSLATRFVDSPALRSAIERGLFGKLKEGGK